MEKKGITIEQFSDKSKIPLDKLNEILYGTPEGYTPERLERLELLLSLDIERIPSAEDRRIAAEISKQPITDVNSAKRYLSTIYSPHLSVNANILVSHLVPLC
ncbi:MAG: hypothetical protein AB9888_08295 [Bacteroidales bacterium]